MSKPSDSVAKALGNLLGGLSAEDFLRHYWQKKPLFIPNALPGFESPIAPDELAGLACEDGVESRLVLEFSGESPWRVEHGPFEEERFAGLPQTHWSLLVQGCDQHVPELAELLSHFAFIPLWRIDDIMVSFAPVHGSVGPHVDQYDVFLIQGLGTRRWQINSRPVADDNFLPGLELNILREFHAEQEWVVQPGDILYLPPGVSHYGVALEDCITLSVGFRAPAHAELISAYLEDAVSRLPPKQRYADPDLQPQAHPGQIGSSALQQVRAILRAAVADDRAIDLWFGAYVTEAKGELPDELAPCAPDDVTSPQEFLALFRDDGYLQRHPAVRFAFISAPQETTLFADGRAFAVPAQLTAAAALLCDRRFVSYDDLADAAENPAFLSLLNDLYQAGYIELADPDFTIEQVTWDEAQRPLRAIRTTVFILEQKVPSELEWDAYDADSRHFLARNNEGRPIGCARLLDDGRLGRLAVLAEHRGKGVGSALLRAAMRAARKLGFTHLRLNAQSQALDFYRRHGFSVTGGEFMEAGIPHREMVLSLTGEAAEPAITSEANQNHAYGLGVNPETLLLTSREEFQKYSLSMAQQAARALYLFTRDLDADLYDNEPFIEAVKRLAIASAGTKVHILLQDPKDVVLHGHRIVELARRLSSHIFIHRAHEDDQKRPENFLLADDAGYLRRANPDRFHGTACFHNPAEVRQYLRFFEDAWQRSHPEPELRRLYI